MLHRTIRTFQRAALRQSFALQCGHIHGFRSQSRPLHTTTGKYFYLAPIWIVINSSIDTKISNLHANVESSLTRQISALDSKFVLKTNDLDSKLSALVSKVSAFESILDSKFHKVDSKLDTMDSKLDTMDPKLDSMFDKHVAKLMAKLGEALPKVIFFVFIVSVVLLSLCPIF